MTPELTYFMKINVALVLFYGFYRLFFYKDTHFTLRRLVLLSFFGLAFLYPLFDMQEWVKAQEPIAEVIYSYSALLPEVVVGEEASASWTQLAARSAFWAYLAVLGALLLRLLIQLSGIVRMARRARRTRIGGVPVYALSEPAGPFSFFRLIFVYPAAHSEKELEEILVHERTHVAQVHSVDVVLTELITIFCWINPFVWLLRREVRHNLEYLADNTVIHAGYDSKTYQFHLLGLANYHPVTHIYNSFHILAIKNRIIMMNKKRSGKIEMTKYLLFLPLMGMLLLFSNVEAVARITKSLAMEIKAVQAPVKVTGTVVDTKGKPMVGVSVVEKGGKSGTLTDSQGNFTIEVGAESTISVSLAGYETVERRVASHQAASKIVMREKADDVVIDQITNQVFTVVEEMPKFPGGDAAMMKFLAENIVYPDASQQAGVQGRVIVSFTVLKTGRIAQAKVERGVTDELDKEALHVIEMMPEWTPGKQKGSAVNVKYTVPVTFRLE